MLLLKNRKLEAYATIDKMPVEQETLQRLAQIPNLAISERTLLSRYTRFGIGGPARVYAETSDEQSFIAALNVARATGSEYTVIGAGTNLIVSDSGFAGIVLRLTSRGISSDGPMVRAEAGAQLQALVDYTIGHGLQGIETMNGIPGSVGAAIHGNAGAYGHSINEWVRQVRFFDGSSIRVIGNRESEFHYRESVFKRQGLDHFFNGVAGWAVSNPPRKLTATGAPFRFWKICAAIRATPSGNCAEIRASPRPRCWCWRWVCAPVSPSSRLWTPH